MSSHEQPIVMPVQNARAPRAKAVALEMVQTLAGRQGRLCSPMR